MKAYLIFINWVLSFCSLSVDTEGTAMWIVMAFVGWFVVSSVALLAAQKRGVFKSFEEKFKMEEL